MRGTRTRDYRTHCIAECGDEVLEYHDCTSISDREVFLWIRFFPSTPNPVSSDNSQTGGCPSSLLWLVRTIVATFSFLATNEHWIRFSCASTDRQLNWLTVIFKCIFGWMPELG